MSLTAKTHKITRAALLAALTCLIPAIAAHATPITTTVNGTDVIYAAGNQSALASSVGGTVPTGYSVSGLSSFTFSADFTQTQYANTAPISVPALATFTEFQATMSVTDVGGNSGPALTLQQYFVVVPVAPSTAGGVACRVLGRTGRLQAARAREGSRGRKGVRSRRLTIEPSRH